mgnify:CR=1 FL=1
MPDLTLIPSKKKISQTTEKGSERVEEILQKSILIFASEGYAGLTMRRVASELGMSLSNLQHYYRSKDLLVEAMLLNILNTFQSKIDSIVNAMDKSSRVEQLKSIVNMFFDELSNGVINNVFFEIWALAGRNEFASALTNRLLARERKAMFQLVHGLVPDISDEEAMQRSMVIVGQLFGSMAFRPHKMTKRADVLKLRTSLRETILSIATAPASAAARATFAKSQ